MNTIPFDLEKFKTGYVAVDGYENGTKHCLVAVCLEAKSDQQLITLNLDNLSIEARTLKGELLDSKCRDFDLIGLLPQKKTGWVQKNIILSDEELSCVSIENRHHFVKVEYYE